MKKLGLVGGLAWPSTADYYRLLCEGTIAHFEDSGHEGMLPTPAIVIESLVMAETRLLRGTRSDEASWSGFDTVFRDCINRLESAGCEVAAIASNTPHARLHAIREGINIPVISIIEETARLTANSNFSSALILGTSVTMQQDNYAQELQKVNIQPNEQLPAEKIAHMQRVIDTEFYRKTESPEGREQIIRYCHEFVGNAETTAVLLACTELPLAFPEHGNSAVFECDGYHFVNTSVAHVNAILNDILG